VAVKSMRGEISADGALKHSSILFADIFDFTEKLKNFSSIFGENASDKIVRWLNQYYSRMTECVIKTNGYTDKFIGDGIMAHWGTAYSAGSPRKDAFNCVKAALMMRKALFFMNRERKPGDHASPVIRMGFGITSGMVTAGQYGSDAHVHYSVIGCPVNLAARINNLTKSQGADILVSEDTWNLIGDKFITKEMPPAKIDGEEKPVRTYAIINFFGEAKGPQSIDELRSILGIETPAN
ncbi:MAG: adenylate/guanylate cyclase domain-containing protein, partial [Treponema sp.]|nr:adenylate/guanylate cyclase domain-containing protein [Treponema sp.]